MPSKPVLSMPARALVLGALSGARSATPLAVLALAHDRRALHGGWQRWRLFASPVGRGVLLSAALGELVADKLPRTPSRIGTGPLVGRAVSGAVVGLALGTVRGGGGSRLQTALYGAVGAVVGSYVGWLGRKVLGTVSGLPDPVVALVEDAITIGGSAAVLAAD